MKLAARWLSIIAHPFVMIGVLVGMAAAARQPAGQVMRSVGLVLAFTVVPLFVLMIRQVRRGAWDNVDASNRSERPILFAVGVAGMVALLGYIAVAQPESFLIRGIVTTLGMMAACALATRWIKVSLHMAFATLAAVSLVPSRVGYGLLVLVPILGWARLTLKRHSSSEVAAGAALGAAAGAALHYL